MKRIKGYIALLTVCVMVLIPTQAAFASGRYLAVAPGETVTAENGDGTNTHFVLDALATTKTEFHVDTGWWRTVYGAVKDEVKRLAPAKYNERDEDIILLLHSRPMDHLKIASLRFRLADGQVATTGQLEESQALRLAPHMFIAPEDERDYIVQGWFFWAQNGRYDVMALDCRESGEIAIHELAHAFTAFETSDGERERIAGLVVESLTNNAEFAALLGGSSLTPHLNAPALVSLEDFIS